MNSYVITYITKRGGHAMIMNTSFEVMRNKMFRLFTQKTEATMTLNNVLIGKVWKDDSQRLGWNYFVEKEAAK